jgi:hypothetical protein
MANAHKFDLSAREVLHGLYYMAMKSSGKSMNLSIEEIDEFIDANAERNKSNGEHPGMVYSCYGSFIGVNVAHGSPDITEYDKYYGEGTAEKAFAFARAMKTTR